MDKKPVDRSVEEEVLNFTKALKKDMSQKDIVALWRSLEHEHSVIEAKQLVARSVFYNVLKSALEEEAMSEATPEAPTGVFR